MIKIRWCSDDESYGLKKNDFYLIEFRSDGQAVLMDVSNLKLSPLGTCVFPSVEKFLDAVEFQGVRENVRRVRKHTDFEKSMFFSVGEVAELFGCSQQTVNNWVKQGRLRLHHRVGTGGHKRFAREDVFGLYQALVKGFD